MERGQLVSEVRLHFPKFRVATELRVEKCYACHSDEPQEVLSLVIGDCVWNEKRSYKVDKHFIGRSWTEIAAKVHKWLSSVDLQPLEECQDSEMVNRVAEPKSVSDLVDGGLAAESEVH